MRSKIVLSILLAGSLSVFGAATIAIVNGDPAGVGFNDPTGAAPVGGNPGTTLGQQRLNAFQAAANKWGATVTSVSTIRVLATWEALNCTPTGAVLGSAGAIVIFRDFTGAKPGRWYGKALASAIFGADLDPATADIRARFNVNLGKSGCLDGIPFYLGLDNNHGSAVDLVTVLTHEFGHGLGFQTFTNGSTGALFSGFPSVWDDYLVNSSTGKNWVEMTVAERAASSLNSGRLAWTGANVTASVPTVFSSGTPLLKVTAPASVANSYLVGTAAFGPALSSPGISGEIWQVVDQPTGNAGFACSPLTGTNLQVLGKIAMVDRGVCTFTLKASNLQAAGAIGMIIVDSAAGSPPAALGGADPTITIPSVRISLADGNALKVALASRTRSRTGVSANLGVDMTVRAGADALGRALMFAPNPFQGGSSVSHFDVSAFPNQLMEPAINLDLTHEITPPFDLTYKLLLDIGWH